jgi:putative hydrolase of the HAD superfamily
VLPWRVKVDPRALFDHWAGRFGAAAVAFADAESVLQELQRRDIRMGLVTNGGSAMQRSKIAALGLDRYMFTIVISDEVRLRKPDAAIFRHALADLGSAAWDTWSLATILIWMSEQRMTPDFRLSGCRPASSN